MDPKHGRPVVGQCVFFHGWHMSGLMRGWQAVFLAATVGCTTSGQNGNDAGTNMTGPSGQTARVHADDTQIATDLGWV